MKTNTTHKITVEQILIWIAAALVLAVLLKGAFFFARHAWLSITFPNTMDYGEGPIVNQAVRLARFQNIYPNDFDEPPYTVTNYPPVFVAAQVPFVWIFGTQFWYGRLISTLAILLAAVSAGLIIHTLTGDKLASVITALTLAGIPYVVEWGATNRVDSLGLGLSLAGLMVIVRHPEQRSRRILGAVLMVLAAYTKQMYAFCAPFAAFIWLLREPPRRKAWELFGWVAGLGLGVFALLTLVTRGGFFSQVITANNNAYYWDTTRFYIDEVKRAFWFYLAIGGVLLLSIFFKPTRHKAWWLAAPYVAGALVVSLAIGKDGSYINYLFELSAAFALLAGLWVWAAGEFFPRQKWLPALFLLVLVVPITRANQLTEERYLARVRDRVSQEFNIQRLYSKVQEYNGIILFDEYMGFLPLMDREIYFQPFERKMLADDGTWDESGFVQEIREQKFDAIIIYYPQWALAERGRWTQAQAEAIREFYVEGPTYAGGTIFIPREEWMHFEIEYDDCPNCGSSSN
ncbi:MAG: glycosyltransferase family 39 protein [Anaerolineae bacterium]|nr:glycosyltransferase family 39 protein [Anaerolineae bacterium]